MILWYNGVCNMICPNVRGGDAKVKTVRVCGVPYGRAEARFESDARSTEAARGDIERKVTHTANRDLWVGWCTSPPIATIRKPSTTWKICVRPTKWDGWYTVVSGITEAQKDKAIRKLRTQCYALRATPETPCTEIGWVVEAEIITKGGDNDDESNGSNG